MKSSAALLLLFILFGCSEVSRKPASPIKGTWTADASIDIVRVANGQSELLEQDTWVGALISIDVVEGSGFMNVSDTYTSTVKEFGDGVSLAGSRSYWFLDMWMVMYSYGHLSEDGGEVVYRFNFIIPPDDVQEDVSLYYHVHFTKLTRVLNH